MSELIGAIEIQPHLHQDEDGRFEWWVDVPAVDLSLPPIKLKADNEEDAKLEANTGLDMFLILLREQFAEAGVGMPMLDLRDDD